MPALLVGGGGHVRLEGGPGGGGGGASCVSLHPSRTCAHARIHTSAHLPAS